MKIKTPPSITKRHCSATYLQWIYNLRITYPKDDILQMTDDISAAFHRVLYHPDMGPAFAAVWKDWLVIPVSSVFGACDNAVYRWVDNEYL
jgi:hypothetical protein